MPSRVRASRSGASVWRSTARQVGPGASRSSKRRLTKGPKPRSRSSPGGCFRADPSSSKRHKPVRADREADLVPRARAPAGSRAVALELRAAAVLVVAVRPARAAAASGAPDLRGLAAGAVSVPDRPVQAAVDLADREALVARRDRPRDLGRERGQTRHRGASARKRSARHAPSPRSKSEATGAGTARSTRTRLVPAARPAARVGAVRRPRRPSTISSITMNRGARDGLRGVGGAHTRRR